MWDELNRMLGGNRKDSLPTGEQTPAPEAPLPENMPAADDRSGDLEKLPAEDALEDRNWDAALARFPTDDETVLPGPVVESAAEATAPPPRSRGVVLAAATTEARRPRAGESRFDQGGDA